MKAEQGGRSRGAKNPVDLTPITGAEERNGGSKIDAGKFKTTERNVYIGDIWWPQTDTANDPLPRRVMKKKRKSGKFTEGLLFETFMN